MLNSTGKTKILKPLCSIFLCFVLLVVFSVPSFANNDGMAQAMWFSKFRYNSVWGRTSDESPYPDGCFVEVWTSDTESTIFNFDRHYTYKFAQPDVNGAVGSTHSPFIWDVVDGRLEIKSTSPIYRLSSGSSTSSWVIYGQSGTSVQEESYIYVNGVLSEVLSNNIKQQASCSFTVSGRTIVASQPPCSLQTDSNGMLYPSYKVSVSTTCLFSACLSADFVNANGSAEDLAVLEDIMANVRQITEDSAVITTRVGDIRTYCNWLASDVSSLLTKVTHIDTISNSFLPYLDDIYNVLDDFYNDFNNYASDDLYYQETISEQLYSVLEKFDKLLENYNSFDSEDTFGSDESGFSDLTGDMEFDSTGIDSVVSSLGSSFNLIKENFETICNLFGLNEVIVLLLGFSVICFILGRAVHNRMRDS